MAAWWGRGVIDLNSHDPMVFHYSSLNKNYNNVYHSMGGSLSYKENFCNPNV